MASPCDACAACTSIRDGRALDVIEIDAASHGAVEDARDLVMRALTAPSELRRRVYIIDEVHMLSTHAFNALLKLIEEPPDHVVFILATTDTHKVPPTIISRTQRHDFRRLAEATIAGKLAASSRPRAPTPITRRWPSSHGWPTAACETPSPSSTRSSPSPTERVTAGDVREAVGLADDDAISGLVDAYVAADAPAALDRVAALADVGRDMAQVAAQAEGEARRRLLASAADPAAARRLALILRSLAEAAGVGAREGRARLMLELLAVEPATASPPRRLPVRPPPSGRCPAGRGSGCRTMTAAAPPAPRADAAPPEPAPPPR